MTTTTLLVAQPQYDIINRKGSKGGRALAQLAQEKNKRKKENFSTTQVFQDLRIYDDNNSELDHSITRQLIHFTYTYSKFKGGVTFLTIVDCEK